jgi:hypothetical protein
VYLCAKTFQLAKEESASGRPIATTLVAGVGKESMPLFEMVPLDGKVETYMANLIAIIKITLYECTKRSLAK